jgi:hypothetical protein
MRHLLLRFSPLVILALHLAGQSPRAGISEGHYGRISTSRRQYRPLDPVVVEIVGRESGDSRCRIRVADPDQKIYLEQDVSLAGNRGTFTFRPSGPTSSPPSWSRCRTEPPPRWSASKPSASPRSWPPRAIPRRMKTPSASPIPATSPPAACTTSSTPGGSRPKPRRKPKPAAAPFDWKEGLAAFRGVEREVQKPEIDRWDKATCEAILGDYERQAQQTSLFGGGPAIPPAVRRRLDEHRKRVELQRSILERRARFEDPVIEPLGILLRVPASLAEGGQ